MVYVSIVCFWGGSRVVLEKCRLSSPLRETKHGSHIDHETEQNNPNLVTWEQRLIKPLIESGCRCDGGMSLASLNS